MTSRGRGLTGSQDSLSFEETRKISCCSNPRCRGGLPVTANSTPRCLAMLFSVLRAPLHLALFPFYSHSLALLSFPLSLLPRLPPSRDCLLSQLCLGCEMHTGIRNKCHFFGHLPLLPQQGGMNLPAPRHTSGIVPGERAQKVWRPSPRARATICILQAKL